MRYKFKKRLVGRIEIKYGKITLISPVNKEEFIADLKKKCNYIFIAQKV